MKRDILCIGVLFPQYLSPVMSIANVFMSIGLGIIFYYIFQDIHGLADDREDFHLVFNSWVNIPLYFGTALYAFEGIGMVRSTQLFLQQHICVLKLLGHVY